MQRTVPPEEPEEKLSAKMQRRVSRETEEKKEDRGPYLSTGSTLLNLAIAGGRVRGGGIPGGILVEIFGPPSSGKTVLLCEIAGEVQRNGGEVRFQDPEARLNHQYARMFGLDMEEVDYGNPNTVTEAFAPLYKWEPRPKGVVHGMFADSLAALSTDMELEAEDKMGMRRAKEFSQELRKIARILPERNILLVCSNQVRENLDAGPYGVRWKSPGGQAIGFYSSLRLRFKGAQKIKANRKVHGAKVARTVGVETEIEVHKSSIWKPFRTAVVPILFDYGIDDIRANLQFLKEHTGNEVYQVGQVRLSNSLEAAVQAVEEEKIEDQLKDEVIDLWGEIEEKFATERTPKRRD